MIRDSRHRPSSFSTRAARAAVLATLTALICAPGPLSQAIAAPAEQAQEREVRRSFSAREGMIVELENLAGSVTIEGAPGGEIEIVGTLRAEAGSTADAESLLNQLEVSFEARGDRIVVEAHYPVDRYDVFRYPERGRNRSTIRYQGERVRVVSRQEDDAVTLYADFRLRLPHGVGADVENNVGDLVSTGVHGRLALDTASGDVTVGDGVGALSADTGSGDVTVQNHEGSVSVDTGSGDVMVSGVRGDVTADTGSGDVEVVDVEADSINADTGSGDVRLTRVSGSLVADTGSGDIDARDLRAGARLVADTGSGGVNLAGDMSHVEEIEIETGNGDVEIRMAAVPPMTLTIETGSGGIDVDLAEMRVIYSRRNSFSGEVRGGGALVTISTGSGSVRVSELR